MSFGGYDPSLSGRVYEPNEASGQPSVTCSAHFLFPEYNLEMELEEIENETEPEKTEEEKMQEYDEFTKSAKAKGMLKEQDSGVDSDLEAMAMSDDQMDKQFEHFKKRIYHYPDQVLRYGRGGEPLWVSKDAVPQPGEIPPCSCGAPRQFEFQVLPQLLNRLDVDSLGDSIDWGTLAIYTCTKSCDEGAAYHREFVWKQDFSDISLNR